MSPYNPPYKKFSGFFAVTLFTFTLLGCSESDPRSAAEPQPAAHDDAIEEVETQPVTELDQVHISEQLLDTYRTTCGNCHERGVVGAPKTGDVAAWAPRMARGMDTLVVHVREGYKTMPPAGLCYSCSDEDFAELIGYMATPK